MNPATEGFNTVYAASCNPSRKAKVPRLSDPSPQSTPSTLVIVAASIAEDVNTPQPQSQPAKRGRKPGTMSKAARETQRKLNHSIIEKARRTKINDALATLRQLVPPGFGDERKHPDQEVEEVDDDDDGDGDGDYQEERRSKPKKPGKKEEKEREFKLEILVRTVAYMQYLIRRVKDLEVQSQVQISSHRSDAKKRKRDTVAEDPDIESNRRQKLDNPIEPAPERASRPRLPSISSWLPEVDPAPKSYSQSPALQPDLASPSLPLPLTSPAHLPSHLPSPPSSTHFVPTNLSAKGLQQLPRLSLGPTAIITRSHTLTTATPAANATPTTPEEESAASLLLNFRRGTNCSPAFLPTPGSAVAFGIGSGGTVTPPNPSPKFTIGITTGESEPVDLALGPSRLKGWSTPAGLPFSLSSSSSESSAARVGRGIVAQTPSSILGLRRG